jgi:hypothetical protein
VRDVYNRSPPVNYTANGRHTTPVSAHLSHYSSLSAVTGEETVDATDHISSRQVLNAPIQLRTLVAHLQFVLQCVCSKYNIQHVVRFHIDISLWCVSI